MRTLRLQQIAILTLGLFTWAACETGADDDLDVDAEPDTLIIEDEGDLEEGVEETGEGLEEAGEAIGEGAEETGEAAAEGVEEAGDAVE